MIFLYVLLFSIILLNYGTQPAHSKSYKSQQHGGGGGGGYGHMGGMGMGNMLGMMMGGMGGMGGMSGMGGMGSMYGMRRPKYGGYNPYGAAPMGRSNFGGFFPPIIMPRFFGDFDPFPRSLGDYDEGYGMMHHGMIMPTAVPRFISPRFNNKGMGMGGGGMGMMGLLGDVMGAGGGLGLRMEDIQNLPITMGPGGQPMVAIPITLPGGFAGKQSGKVQPRLEQDPDGDTDADADADTDSSKEGEKNPKPRLYTSNKKKKENKWDS